MVKLLGCGWGVIGLRVAQWSRIISKQSRKGLENEPGLSAQQLPSTTKN